MEQIIIFLGWLAGVVATELTTASHLSLAEWLGCLTGVAGSALLAANNRWSGYGFVLFMVSNLCWIAYALMNGIYGLVAMQMAFTFTSGLGIWRWLVKPRLAHVHGGHLLMVRLA